MSLEEDLALVMATGRKRLSAEVQGLLPAGVVWPLSVLLVTWSARKDERQKKPLPVDIAAVYGAFDYLQDALLRLLRAVAAPSSLPNEARLAGLGAQFAVLVGNLGPVTVRQMTSNAQFQRVADDVNRRYPIPPSVLAAFEGTALHVGPKRNRIRDYDGFDAPQRNLDNSPAYVRSQLDRDDLSAEMRMYYEQRMQFLGVPMYRSEDEARIVWSSMADLPMSDEVRAYFATNLNDLNGTSETEV